MRVLRASAGPAVMLAGLALSAYLGRGPTVTTPGDPPIFDAGSLPSDLTLCRRQWESSGADYQLRLGEIRDIYGVEPAVVDPRPGAPCRPGPCTDVAGSEPCHTVIFIRVGTDAYVEYALRGGP